MAGIGHRGFFGRNQGGGFRYLHDEISGGLNALGMLSSVSGYSGDCVRVNLIDYGFLNNYVDKAAILSANPGDTAVSDLYDQLENDDFNSNTSSRWIPTENDLIDYETAIGDGMKTYSYSGALNWNAAKTILLVVKRNNATISATESLFTYRTSNGNNNQIFSIIQLSGGVIQIFGRDTVGGGGNTIINYPVFNSTDRTLIVLTHDGSTGYNLYVQDMVTGQTPSSSTTGTSWTAASGTLMTIGCFASLEFEGFINETHVFNKVLSQSERETAKEILEQSYTFS